ncbi:MAG TPA: hypothetical protein ENH84_01915 [Phycisphaerae bacterium]|nr:hypothetical protein [Phycisphaerae bacterium]
MLAIIAQTTQPVQSLEGLVYSYFPILLAGLLSMIGVLVGSTLTYWLGFLKERKLKEAKKKEEFPGRLMGASEECFMLMVEDMKQAVMAINSKEALRLAQSAEQRDFAQKTLVSFENKRMNAVAGIAKSCGDVLRILGEMRYVYRKDKELRTKTDSALKALWDFDGNEMDQGIDNTDGWTGDQWDNWCKEQQKLSAEFVKDRFKRHVDEVVNIILQRK